MLDTSLTLKLILLFFLTSVILFVVRIVCLRLELVDKPNNRKRHKGNIPLAGGITFYLGIGLLGYFIPNIPNYYLLMLCLTILIIVGVADDKYDLPVIPRLLIQFLVGFILTLAGICFSHIGIIDLGFIGIIFTILAVSGSINAFNMIDGIDGSLGSISIITFLFLSIMFYLNDQTIYMKFCLSLAVVMFSYLIFNLSLIGKKYKIFMGDSGSTLIGFIMVFLLIILTQDTPRAMSPVNALWLIAVPLIDMVSVMARRILSGKSPFKADRMHLHHLLIRSGLTTNQSLFIMCIIAISLSLVGVFFEELKLSQFLSLLLFLILICLYVKYTKYCWIYLYKLNKN